MKMYKPEKTVMQNALRYKNKEEAQADHRDNYRSDGIAKGKGMQQSSDYHRVEYIVAHTPDDAKVLDVGCNGGTIGVPLIKVRNAYVK